MPNPRRRRTKTMTRPRHDPIPVAEAITLYASLRSWTKVARVLKRESGQHWHPESIKLAVRRELPVLFANLANLPPGATHENGK